MANRTGNYCAFYVAEPFNQNNLGANAAKDFCYFLSLKSKALPTQMILNFSIRMGQCKILFY